MSLIHETRCGAPIVALGSVAVVAFVAVIAPACAATSSSAKVVAQPPASSARTPKRHDLPMVPIDLRNAALVSVVLPKPRRAFTQISAYAQGLKAIPALGRLVSVEGLLRTVFWGLAPSLDLQRPVALAEIDEGKSPRFRWRRALIVALPLRDRAAFEARLTHLIGPSRPLSPDVIVFSSRRGREHLWLRFVSGWAYLARTRRLIRGAASVLGPLVACAAGPPRLVVHAERVRRRFPRAWGYASAVLASRTRGGHVAWRLLSEVLGLPGLVSLAVEARVVEARVVLKPEGMGLSFRVTGSAPVFGASRRFSALWGTDLMPASLPLVVASRKRPGAALDPLAALLRTASHRGRSSLDLPGRGSLAHLAAAAKRLGAELGEGRVWALGAPASSSRLVAVGVAQVKAGARKVERHARHFLRALAAVAPRLLSSWVGSGLLASRSHLRPVSIGGGRAQLLEMSWGPAARRRGAGPMRVLGRRILGPRPCLAWARVETSTRGSLFLWAAGSACRRRLLALGRRCRGPRLPGRRRFFAQPRLGRPSRLVALSLTGALRQAFPWASAAGKLSPQTGALARMLLPPSARALSPELTAWNAPSQGAVHIGHATISKGVLDLVTKLAVLMFRVGSYGGVKRPALP